MSKGWFKTWRQDSKDLASRTRTTHWGWAWLPFGKQILLRTQQMLLAIRVALHRYAGLISVPGTKELNLLEWEQVDECFREPGIHRWYRAKGLTLPQCIASTFVATNETSNFWTHFLPTFYFIWRYFRLSLQYDYSEDYYSLPLFIYLISASLYPLVSSVAHAFSAMSTNARHICFFLDYSAISMYSFGSGLLYRAYVLPDELLVSSFSSIFLIGCIFNSVVCTMVACLSRFIGYSLLQKTCRLGSFVLPYLWVTAPLIYRLLSCSDILLQNSIDSSLCNISSVYHRAQLISAAAASFFYASHLPERFYPGRFDLIGHSHNLLHIFGVMATAMQLEGALLDMESRKTTLIESHLALDYTTISISAFTVAVFNLCIVCIFTIYVLKFNRTTKQSIKMKYT